MWLHTFQVQRIKEAVTKTTHWTFHNGSGLSNVATDLAAAERALGIEAITCDTTKKDTWAAGMDADVHVVHSHIPDELAFNPKTKIVCFQHGSPGHTFQVSIEQGIRGGYGAGDSWSIGMFFLRRADVVATFWPRHEAIWRTMTDKPVCTLPMGVDRSFWMHQEVGPLAGEPSIFTCENAHTVKWPEDLMTCLPWVLPEFPGLRLHAINVPTDQMRWWTSKSFANATHYISYLYSLKLDRVGLRQFYSAAGYYLSPVRYGDFNRVSMEASACGCKVISFEGNEYADYWIREGDERRQAQDLLKILKGDVEPRVDKLPVPDISDTAKGMLQIYAGLGVL